MAEDNTLNEGWSRLGWGHGNTDELLNLRSLEWCFSNYLRSVGFTGKQAGNREGLGNKLLFGFSQWISYWCALGKIFGHLLISHHTSDSWFAKISNNQSRLSHVIVQGVCVDFESALSSLLLTIGRLAVILNEFFTSSPVFWEWIDFSDWHEMLDGIVCYLFSLFLKVSNELLQNID